MTDIATNICTWPSCGHTANGQCKTRNFDVDLITTLRAEVERLRAALRLIAEHPVEQSGQWEIGSKEMLKVARAALEGK